MGDGVGVTVGSGVLVGAAVGVAVLVGGVGGASDSCKLSTFTRGFLPNPSKRCNPDFLANPTSGGDYYKLAKSSNFQILILESLPLVISLN